jgi:hypothetical protein
MRSKEQTLKVLLTALQNHFQGRNFTLSAVPSAICAEVNIESTTMKAYIMDLCRANKLTISGKVATASPGIFANVFSFVSEKKAVEVKKPRAKPLKQLTVEPAAKGLRALVIGVRHVQYCQALEKRFGHGETDMAGRHAVAAELGKKIHRENVLHWECLSLGLLESINPADRRKGSRLTAKYFESFGLRVETPVVEKRDEVVKIGPLVLEYCALIEAQFGRGDFRSLNRDQLAKDKGLDLPVTRSRHRQAVSRGLIESYKPGSDSEGAIYHLSALYFEKHSTVPAPPVVEEPKVVTPEFQEESLTNNEFEEAAEGSNLTCEYCALAAQQFGTREFTSQERDRLAKKLGVSLKVLRARHRYAIRAGFIHSHLPGAKCEGTVSHLTTKYFERFGQVPTVVSSKEVSAVVPPASTVPEVKAPVVEANVSMSEKSKVEYGDRPVLSLTAVEMEMFSNLAQLPLTRFKGKNRIAEGLIEVPPSVRGQRDRVRDRFVEKLVDIGMFHYVITGNLGRVYHLDEDVYRYWCDRGTELIDDGPQQREKMLLELQQLRASKEALELEKRGHENQRDELLRQAEDLKPDLDTASKAASEAEAAFKLAMERYIKVRDRNSSLRDGAAASTEQLKLFEDLKGTRYRGIIERIQKIQEALEKLDQREASNG